MDMVLFILILTGATIAGAAILAVTGATFTTELILFWTPAAFAIWLSTR